MRKIFISLKIIFTICLIFLIYLLFDYLCTSTVAYVSDFNNYESYSLNKSSIQDIDKNESNVMSFILPTFGEKTINRCEYMYSLDGENDYIYIEFETGGYAIYAKNTMELLEYSLNGKTPYYGMDDVKYYAGPQNYLRKEKESFVDAVSGDDILVLKKDMKEISNRI